MSISKLTIPSARIFAQFFPMKASSFGTLFARLSLLHHYFICWCINCTSIDCEEQSFTLLSFEKLSLATAGQINTVINTKLVSNNGSDASMKNVSAFSMFDLEKLSIKRFKCKFESLIDLIEINKSLIMDSPISDFYPYTIKINLPSIFNSTLPIYIVLKLKKNQENLVVVLKKMEDGKVVLKRGEYNGKSLYMFQFVTEENTMVYVLGESQYQVNKLCSLFNYVKQVYTIDAAYKSMITIYRKHILMAGKIRKYGGQDNIILDQICSILNCFAANTIEIRKSFNFEALLEVVDMSFIDTKVYYKVLKHLIHKFKSNSCADETLEPHVTENTGPSKPTKIYVRLKALLDSVGQDLNELENKFQVIEKIYVLKQSNKLPSSHNLPNTDSGVKNITSSRMRAIRKFLLSYFTIVEEEVCMDILSLCRLENDHVPAKKKEIVMENTVTELMEIRNCLRVLGGCKSSFNDLASIANNNCYFQNIRLSDMVKVLRQAFTKITKSKFPDEVDKAAFYKETLDFWNNTIKASQGSESFLNVWILGEVLKEDNKKTNNSRKTRRTFVK